MNKPKIPIALLVVNFVVFGVAGNENLQTACNVLKTEPYQYVCFGTYPLELIRKHRDARVSVDDPYTIFTGGSNHYLVTFKKSSLHHACKEIQIIDADHYDCTDEDAISKSVEIPLSTLRCYAYQLHLMDDLLKACGQSNPKTEFAALHYPGSSSVIRCSPFCIILAILPIFCGGFKI